ncbi:MAG: curlin [Sediminimonas qiaohouensis]|uniref:Curlin n=1 Tax=Sediminimonas qiaohouensis TaxID=552061 RepID=A0A7C9HBA2_9RHOB|nr:hypothetical protein [Sediminimonas qiaohouensis]MTJ05049.1 curlin [Sediminimonas qiaohouensis]
MKPVISTFSAIAFAAGLALPGGLTAPAQAGGNLSVELTPRNAEEERAMRVGLGIYAVVQNAKQAANVNQRGNGNAAAIGQRGNGNYGAVHQEGDGHDASLRQSGNGNAYGIFQFGDGASGHVNQRGNGGTGMLIQYGWK